MIEGECGKRVFCHSINKVMCLSYAAFRSIFNYQIHCNLIRLIYESGSEHGEELLSVNLSQTERSTEQVDINLNSTTYVKQQHKSVNALISGITTMPKDHK